MDFQAALYYQWSSQSHNCQNKLLSASISPNGAPYAFGGAEFDTRRHFRVALVSGVDPI
jgi:hypothetical protein